jgi:omega-3 fatty acid desaturase (delta-15 desaturase)
VPLTQAQLEALPRFSRWLRLRGFLLAFPFYLLRGTPGREYGSHYDPRCALFRPGERRRVALSVALCGLWLLGLAALALWQGPTGVLRHFFLPWLVFCLWAALVTYLHHTDPAVPWYRDPEWTPLRGALATVDRSYGLFEAVHHQAGCHTAHHLFPAIPHHQLRRATAALRPILGEALRASPAPIWRALPASAQRCQVIAPTGAEVRYEARVA